MVKKRMILLLVCLLLLPLAPIWAQATGGTFSGRVTNASGANVPNAAVTITEINTNATQRVLTGPDGTFSIGGLAVGTYRVDVEITGYKRTSQQNIELTASGPVSVNVTLEAGNVNETVEVQGSAPVIQTDNAQIGVALGTRTVRELPVVDRNYQQLIELQPGITPPQPAYDLVQDPARNRYFSTNGQSPLVNMPQVDGVMNLEPFSGSAVRVQPEESIQQLNIVSANPTVENGFAAGTFYTPVTRGGTNGWHGSLFEFYNGNILNTRSFFNTAGNPDARFTYNQMGATVGGAIVPDKTFFFGSYEGTFANGGMTQLATVPTSQAVTGNFSAIPGLTVVNPSTGLPYAGNTLAPGQINPTAAAIAGLLPSPNLPGYVDNYVSNTPFRNDVSKFDGKIDQHFSDRTSAFLRYGYSNFWASQDSPYGSTIGAGTNDRLLAQNAVAGVTHEITPSLITDFRFGYNRYDQKLNYNGDQSALGIGTNNLTGININGMLPIGATAYLPENAVDNTFDWAWNWSLHTTTHNIKWGVDVRRIRSDGFTETPFTSAFGPNGTAYFGPGATLANGAALSPYGEFYNSFASFLAGAPSQVGLSSYLTTPTIRQTEYSAWIGDTLKFMQRFTLDLGLRYDIFSPLSPRNPGGAEYYDSTTDTFSYAGTSPTPMGSGLYQLHNFAPRIGLAAAVTKKTAIRAAYGIQYFQNPYLYSGFMAPATGFVSGLQGVYGSAPITGVFGPTTTNPNAPTGALLNAPGDNLPATVLSRNTPTPYVQQFSAQLQQEFYWTTVLSLGYVGSVDRHLSYFDELNGALPGTGITGLPFYSTTGRTASTLYVNNGLTSNYNALQVSLNKRFSQGLSFMASYTWSKALGYTSGNNFLLNPSNLGSNYGPLDWDHQNVLTISHLWELPFGRHGNSMASTILGGWELNGIFSWNDGSPLTITADPISCACPNSTVFASPSGNGPVVLNSGTTYLNPAAFTTTPGTNGALGRGSIFGPGYRNYDLALFKNFRYHERFNFELRGEAYNLTNSPHFANPVTNVSAADFGQSLSTIGTYNGAFGRQINLGLRLMF